MVVILSPIQRVSIKINYCLVSDENRLSFSILMASERSDKILHQPEPLINKGNISEQDTDSELSPEECKKRMVN